MRCERICALGRYVIANSVNPAFTASTSGLSARSTTRPTGASP
jgi:hypothetical protein